MQPESIPPLSFSEERRLQRPTTGDKRYREGKESGAKIKPEVFSESLKTK